MTIVKDSWIEGPVFTSIAFISPATWFIVFPTDYQPGSSVTSNPIIVN